jgi:hypothetical protein
MKPPGLAMTVESSGAFRICALAKRRFPRRSVPGT